LQPLGIAAVEDFSTTLLDYIKDNDGHCTLNDKSDPEEIKRQFHVSKKSIQEGYWRSLQEEADNIG
jgi:predicted RNA-binding protein (virulence factor B family)